MNARRGAPHKEKRARRALRARGGGSKIQKPKIFWREDFLEGNANAKDIHT